jgi:hypothetical protein
MALSAGSITVNPTTGAHTGSGMAFEILDAWWTAKSGDYAEATVATIVAVKEGIATLLQAIAAGIVAEITTNGEVTVTVGTNDAGLQRLPSPPDAGAATIAPATPVALAGTIS